MQLGFCKRCASPMAVVRKFCQDGEGRFLSPEGQVVERTPDGVFTSRVDTAWKVACSACSLEDPDHPYQKEIDQARAGQPPLDSGIPSIAPGSSYSQFGPMEALERRQARLEARIESLARLVDKLLQEGPRGQEKPSREKSRA